MKLYTLHSNPKELHGFDVVTSKIQLLYQLAKENTDMRPKLEPHIMKDPKRAYAYADYILDRRWPEAEQYIMKDPESAYFYAVYVLKRRWSEAEPVIMKDPKYACMYASRALERPWPEAEPYIMKDPNSWDYYKRHFNL